jgi:hypothetical protein
LALQKDVGVNGVDDVAAVGFAGSAYVADDDTEATSGLEPVEALLPDDRELVEKMLAVV